MSNYYTYNGIPIPLEPPMVDEEVTEWFAAQYDNYYKREVRIRDSLNKRLQNEIESLKATVRNQQTELKALREMHANQSHTINRLLQVETRLNQEIAELRDAAEHLPDDSKDYEVILGYKIENGELCRIEPYYDPSTPEGLNRLDELVNTFPDVIYFTLTIKDI